MDHVTTQQPQAIAKVFIQRDYSDGTAVKFQTKLPADIHDRVMILQNILLQICQY